MQKTCFAKVCMARCSYGFLVRIVYVANYVHLHTTYVQT